MGRTRAWDRSTPQFRAVYVGDATGSPPLADGDLTRAPEAVAGS